MAASPDRTQDGSVSGTSGTTIEVVHPFLWDGISSSEGILTPPSVAWGFETSGGSWFDVASFHVDYRYLAIKR